MKKVVWIFFAVFLLVGIAVFDDFGISWDEEIQRRYGYEVYEYIFEGNDKLLRSNEKYYGPTFEFTLVAIEKFFSITDSREIYLMRHFVTFILFFYSSILFYKLLVSRFKSEVLGLLGVLILISSPRIFSHSFYNSKDLAFMSVFIISAYTFFRFFSEKTTKNFIYHSIASALVITLRIGGLIVPLLTLCVILIDFLKSKKGDYSLKEYFRNSLLYLLVVFGLVVLLWPSLWHSPVSNFIEAYKEASSFPHKGSVLYLGDFIKSDQLPWHYLPVWISITTPIPYLVGFLLGSYLLAKRNFNMNRFDLFVSGWLLLPLATVFVFKPVMYDSWRQMFFIYPAIVYICIYGLYAVKKDERYFTIVTLFLSVGILFSFISIYKGHPLQNTYFNALGGKRPHINFAYDYWGLSYRTGLEFILETDTSEQILVSVENYPGITNVNILAQEDRNRLEVIEDIGNADYYLTNYRDEGQYKTHVHYNPYSEVLSYGRTALGIYKAEKQ